MDFIQHLPASPILWKTISLGLAAIIGFYFIPLTRKYWKLRDELDEIKDNALVKLGTQMSKIENELGDIKDILNTGAKNIKEIVADINNKVNSAIKLVESNNTGIRFTINEAKIIKNLIIRKYLIPNTSKRNDLEEENLIYLLNELGTDLDGMSSKNMRIDNYSGNLSNDPD